MLSYCTNPWSMHVSSHTFVITQQEIDRFRTKNWRLD